MIKLEVIVKCFKNCCISINRDSIEDDFVFGDCESETGNELVDELAMRGTESVQSENDDYNYCNT